MLRLFCGFCADARWVKAVTLAAIFVSASALADTPPTVAVPASANPSVVTTKTTVLSVLGADDGGAANLVYTWSTVNTPPAVPAYTRNGNNAAKQTTVTFNADGSYKFHVVISDKAGQTATSEVTVAVSATPTSIALSPTSLRMNPGTSRTFTALVRDQFVKNLAPQPAVAFAISGGGTVSSDGVFTAAAPGGPYTLTASSCGRQATASITVNAAPAFATPAAVSANPVTTKNVVATVLGADDAGEAALTYIWSAIGPASVRFFPNASKLAKTTQATFTKPGHYVLKAVVKDAQALTATSTVPVTVVATAARIVVTPASVALDPLSTRQFSATAYDQFNVLMASQPAFTWSAQDISINASGLATADGDAGVSYPVFAHVGGIFGSAVLQINNVPTPPKPVITPAGGSFSQSQAVTITPAVLAPLTNTPGWRTGVKYPGQGLESVAALSQDGATVAAMRARTAARIRWQFPGASLSPDSGPFPFYIWSLADLSATYYPALFAGVTESTDWDGNNYDFWYAETGNRVFMLMTQHWTGTGGDISLWSCAAGLTQGATPSQQLASFARIPISTFAGQATRFEFAGEKVRLIVGAAPLVSATTDANGWVTYTGTNGSGRVTAPLGATRFWLTLAGGDPVGSREMIISDKPKTTTRFTFDGSPVTEASPAVTGPLTLTHDATLRARVYSAAAYRSPETVAVFTSNIPLLPAESVVSPAYLSIAHAPLDGTPAQVSLDGPSGVMTGLPIGDFRYLMRYPLLPDAPTPLTLHRSGLADLTGSVLWRALEIGVAPDTQIRLGESVILSASSTIAGERVITVTDASGAVYTEHRTLNTEHSSFPVLFDRAGTFTAVATLDGISFASLVISVTQVDLQGPIACQIGYRREKEVLVYGPAYAVFFTANDPTLLQVSVKETTARGVRLYLKPLKAGTPILQARLGSPTGTILAQQEVDEFTMRSQSTTTIGVVETFPDGSKRVQTNLEMDPQVLDLGVNLHIIIRGVTFEDSTLDKILTTNAFTYDPVSGKWLYAYQMIATPDLFTGTCHSIAIYQGSDPVGQ
jgi:hypothetical protein